MIVDEWRAPDLNCERLKWETRRLRPDGSLRARNTDEVISLTLGEPNPDLFSVPAEYTERPPAQALSEVDRRKGQECVGDCQSGRATLNSVYFSAQTDKE
jgi:hypothetical protein